jgi:hypothetical protein
VMTIRNELKVVICQVGSLDKLTDFITVVSALMGERFLDFGHHF